MKLNTISQTIADTVSTWEGVTIVPHRFGGIEFRVDDREIGHSMNRNEFQSVLQFGSISTLPNDSPLVEAGV